MPSQLLPICKLVAVAPHQPITNVEADVFYLGARLYYQESLSFSTLALELFVYSSTGTISLRRLRFQAPDKALIITADQIMSVNQRQ